MSRTIRGAGETSPPAPGLVQNANGEWGSYVAAADAPQGLANSSAETVFVPYTSPSNFMPTRPFVRATGDSTAGTTGTGDSTSGTTGTGDATAARVAATGDSFSPLAGLGDRSGSRLPSLLPFVRQVIPCTPSWTPRSYGGRNLAPPSLGPVLGAGAASVTADITVADVFGWVAFGLGAVVGQRLIDNIYEQRRAI